MRLKLTIAYDGRPFAGYAIQPEKDTIQARLESALADILKTPTRVHHAGRTDAGVHALGQIVHFDAPDGTSMNPFNYLPALNTKLPPSIRIMDCTEVSPDFHARFSAKQKTYTYRLSLAPILPPFDAGLAWHLPRQLDPDTLTDILTLYQGTHDFRNFAANRGNETEDTDYTRSIYQTTLTELPDGYLLTYTGNGFLYRMVRLLTGTAVHTAQGRFRPDQVSDLLTNPQPNDQKAPLCAPPDGLTLQQVTY